MLKLILKSLLISMLLAQTVFADIDANADDNIGPFDQSGDALKYPKPNAEKNYLASRAPMPLELRRYFGLGVGASSSTLKPTITVTTAQSISPSKISYAGNIYGGLGTNFDHFYIGAELSGGYNSLNKNSTVATTTITFKQPITAGLDFIPGYLTQQKDFLFYGRFGAGASLFNIKVKNNAAVSDSNKKFVFGWRAGLGMEYFLCDAFSTRLEYIFSTYSNINYTASTYSYKLSSPRTQQVNLGLTINF